MLLEEAEGALFIGELRGGVRAPPVDTWTRCPATNGVNERGRRRVAHAGTVGERGRALGHWGDDEHSAHRTVTLAEPRPCSLRRAPASASVRGELMALRRGWWQSLARSGRRGKRARANIALGGTQSASTRRHDMVDTRGHRANSLLRPAFIQKSCLACCSW